MRKRRERHLLASGGNHINIFQRFRVLLILRSQFHDHMILIERHINSRDLPLTKRIIEHRIDLGDGNSKARHLITIHGQRGLQTFAVLI